jgi:general secretion pathway protein D
MRASLRSALAALALALVATPVLSQGNDPAEWPLVRLEFRDAKVVDVLRLLAEVSPLNIVASDAAGKKTVSLYLQNVTARAALETICKASGLWFREDPASRTIRVLTTDEYQKDLVIFREDRIRIFTLLHPNATTIAKTIESVFGERVRLSLGVQEDVSGLQTYGNNALLGGLGGSGTSGGLGGGASGGLGGAGGAGLAGSGLGRTSGGFGGTTRGVVTGGITNRNGDQTTQAQNLVQEQFTPEQLAEIEKRRSATGETKEALTSEDLRGISRREAPIFVTVNSPHNLLVVRTSDERALSEVGDLIKDLDRPTSQVLLEMKVLELNLADDFSSAFDFDYVQPGAQNAGNSIAGKNNPFLATGVTAPANVVGAGNFNLNPASALVYQFLNDKIRARIQLLETENRVNALSTPLLLCVNHGAARIFVGEERPITQGFQAQNTFTQATASTLVVPQTTLTDVGSTLLVVPQINADRTVTLTILQESSTLNPGAAQIPVPLSNGNVQSFAVDTISASDLSVTVVAKDGMTVAVGGLIEDKITKSETKVPFLGDIPLLGFFFRSTDNQRSRTELMLLITPRVLFTPAEAEGVSRERLLALSIHPYQDKGDQGSRAYEKHEVPAAERSHVIFRDLLTPDAEPVK